MKTLFLVRHAKSSRDEAGLPDRQRPLAERGRHDAPEMGKRLAARPVHPDLILCSPARRALETAQIIARKLDYKSADIVVVERLYAAQANELLTLIHSLDDEFERVMLFGHNPALEELAYHLSKTITRMPTCAVVDFDFEAESWSKADTATVARVGLDYPKNPPGDRAPSVS